MKISVALCTYNAETYLRDQLESIANQTVLPHELIVCDDCSTDGTISLLKDFARRAPFVTTISCNPSNLGYKRNFVQAVGLCTGEIIALCDQDDVWYPQKLARAKAAFEGDPEVDGFFSDGDVIGADSRKFKRRLWESFFFRPEDCLRVNSGEAIDVLLKRNVVTGMTLAFRSRMKNSLTALPESWIHDGWIAFLIAVQSRLVACPERLVAYRVHGAQQIGTPLTVKQKLRWILGHGALAYLREVHRRNLDEYRRLAVQFDDLARFLQGSPQIDPALLVKINAKADHARRGATALTSSRFARWKVLSGGLAGYSRFSPTGLRAIARDLLV